MKRVQAQPHTCVITTATTRHVHEMLYRLEGVVADITVPQGTFRGTIAGSLWRDGSFIFLPEDAPGDRRIPFGAVTEIRLVGTERVTR